jgi:hypothetical protein
MLTRSVVCAMLVGVAAFPAMAPVRGAACDESDRHSSRRRNARRGRRCGNLCESDAQRRSQQRERHAVPDLITLQATPHEGGSRVRRPKDVGIFDDEGHG